jgi:hypothetical protein
LDKAARVEIMKEDPALGMRLYTSLSCDDTVFAARSTGTHSGRHATGWFASASLLATLDLVTCGRNKAALQATATPMRTSTRKLEASFFACRG